FCLCARGRPGTLARTDHRLGWCAYVLESPSATQFIFAAAPVASLALHYQYWWSYAPACISHAAPAPTDDKNLPDVWVNLGFSIYLLAAGRVRASPYLHG